MSSHPPQHGSSSNPNDHSATVAMVTSADLVCGLCRKRTGEIVTKLCHGCGLPVHLSCAQHVAARECDLELGFPLPALYCSKRCYDEGYLGDNGASTTENEATLVTTNGGANSGRWSLQMPNEVTAALTLKIGDVSRTSRKHLTITTFRFLLSEGFEVFKAKVNSRAIKELQSFAGEKHVREDTAIYIRPGVHSKQAELVELGDENFESRIRKTFRNFLKRKNTQTSSAALAAAALRQEQFECDIYIYVKKESTIHRRVRPTASGHAHSNVHSTTAVDSANHRRTGKTRPAVGDTQQQDHQQRQDLFQTLSGRQNDFADPAAMNSNTSSASLLIDGQSGGATTSSLVGAKRSRMGDAQDRPDQQSAVSGYSDGDMMIPGYKTIRMVLNGSVVAVKLNVSDLLSALGLPTTAMDGPAASSVVSLTGETALL